MLLVLVYSGHVLRTVNFFPCSGVVVGDVWSLKVAFLDHHSMIRPWPTLATARTALFSITAKDIRVT